MMPNVNLEKYRERSKELKRWFKERANIDGNDRLIWLVSLGAFIAVLLLALFFFSGDVPIQEPAVLEMQESR